MRRVTIQPRANWEATVESQGFCFHTADEGPYWDESAFYEFAAKEIDEIEKATYALDKMCLAAAEKVVEEKLFERFQIPPAFAAFVTGSWEKDELTIYGRFDLAVDGVHPPKLLEYNADTPTGLLEAAVVQWQWMKDARPGADQFNSIHERLIEAWGVAKTTIPAATAGPVTFSALKGYLEDYMTVNYLRDTAMQAGLQTQYIDVDDIGFNGPSGKFVDMSERPLGCVFKLYPWEWMVRERFAGHLLEDRAVAWLEAPWKMILSNKALLPLLWEMYPASPYLLEASMEPLRGSYVKKPVFGREGANVSVVVNDQPVVETEGPYEGPWVYQRLQGLPSFDGNYPVVGSWMVNGWACGMGIREDVTPVTGNLSRFVPHVIG